MITFTRSVGTSPGTTILTRNGVPRTLGVQQCWPVPKPIHLAPDQSRVAPAAGPRVATVLDPYATPAEMNGGLGLVLTPQEINRTLPGGPPYLKPFDPQYTTSGERGFYYDTPLGGPQLGAIPTDAECATNICYTPVKSGWIYSKEGYIPPPYVPPDEWRPVAPQFGPPTSLTGGLGAAEASLGQAAGQLNDATEEIAKHQRRMFYLSIISTTAVAAVAIATIIKATRSS